MSLPLISIITPSYNQADYLERTICSVLDQNYPRLRYIIMDGGSQDGSVDIIKRYEKHLYHWVSGKDGGQSFALNTGLGYCSGEWIGYINSDDWYEPGAFHRLADIAAHRPEVEWVIGGCEYHSEDTGKVELARAFYSEDPGQWIGFGLSFPQASSFWSSSLLRSDRGFRTDLQYVFDTEFATRLMLMGKRPLIVEPVLAHRWLHANCKTCAFEARFSQELDRFPEIFAGELSPLESYYARSYMLRRHLAEAEEREPLMVRLRLILRLFAINPRSAISYVRSLIEKAYRDRLRGKAHGE